jgi:hypothetical protein
MAFGRPTIKLSEHSRPLTKFFLFVGKTSGEYDITVPSTCSERHNRLTESTNFRLDRLALILLDDFFPSYQLFTQEDRHSTILHDNMEDAWEIWETAIPQTFRLIQDHTHGDVTYEVAERQVDLGLDNGYQLVSSLTSSHFIVTEFMSNTGPLDLSYTPSTSKSLVVIASHLSPQGNAADISLLQRCTTCTGLTRIIAVSRGLFNLTSRILHSLQMFFRMELEALSDLVNSRITKPPKVKTTQRTISDRKVERLHAIVTPDIVQVSNNLVTEQERNWLSNTAGRPRDPFQEEPDSDSDSDDDGDGTSTSGTGTDALLELANARKPVNTGTDHDSKALSTPPSNSKPGDHTGRSSEFILSTLFIFA